MILIRRCKKLFSTSYIIAHNISDSQFYITDLCNKYNSSSFKIKIPIHIYNLRNVEILYCNNVKRNYCNEKSTESKDMLLSESIDNGGINLRTMKLIIEDLENNPCYIPETLSLKLLICCGHVLYAEPLQIRRELTIRVWNLLQQRECKLTLPLYHALLRTFIDNDYRVYPKAFLETMLTNPTDVTYGLLLRALPKITDYNKFEKQIAIIYKAESNYKKIVYDSLVYAYAINGYTEKARNVIELMKQLNIEPSVRTYSYLMFAFAINNDIKSVCNTLLTYTSSKKTVMKLIKFLSLSGNGIHIPDILIYLKPLKEERYSVVSLIIQLVHTGHYLDAYNVIAHIRVINDSLKTTFALYFLEEMIKLNIDKEIILQFINDFATKACIPDIWNEAALLSLKRTDERIAIAILNEMKESGVSIASDCFWPFFLDENVCDQETHIYSIIRRMIALDVEIDSTTLVNYVFPYIDTSDPVTTVLKLMQNGVSVTCIIEAFVRFLLNSNRLKESLFVCSHFKKKMDCKNYLHSLYFSYTRSKDINSCIDFLFKSSYNGSGFAVSFLKKLLDHLKDNPNDSGDIITFLNAMKCYKAVIPPYQMKRIAKSFWYHNMGDDALELVSELKADTTDNCNYRDFIHPQYMNSEQLYLHFQELKHAKKNTRGVVRKLLMAFCNQNDTRIDEIIQEMNSNNLQWTPGMRLSLFDYYVRNKVISEASFILREIRSEFPEFKIDNFKLIHFATLLIEHNEIDEAFNILNTCTVNRKPNANSAIENLLKLLITKDTSNYTEKMVHLLVKQKYCENYDRILRYLVLVHVLRDDIKSATNVFINCVKQYKKTPAKQELLVKILKSISDSFPQNRDLLQNIYDLIANVHGKDKANVNLAIALSLCNKKEELQCLLKKKYISDIILLHQLKYLKDDDIITVTLRMLESIEDMTKINLEPICHLTLSICDKRNDYEHALELEKCIKEKNIKCNADFDRILSKLLTSKLQFPNNIITGN